MGIIQKGSSLSTFYLVIGILLGFVTSGLLIPNYFTKEQNGVGIQLSSYFLIYSQVVLLGLHTTVIRFYPHFKDDATRHRGFLTIVSLVILCSILLFSVLFFSSLYLAPSFFEDSPLFGQYYWLVFPLTAFTVYFYLFDAYYSAQLKGSRGFFLKDVFQRILIILAIFGFIIWHFSFHSFVIIYCIATCIPTLIFMVMLLREKQFSFTPRITAMYKENWKYMTKVSGYSLLLGISWVGITNIDAIMIEKMLNLEQVGIYGRNMFFGILVSVPYRAIHKVSSGVISNSFKENNLENVKTVYYKSSLNQMIIGAFIFCGLWLNIKNIYQLIPASYEAGKYVILFIGLGNFFTMIGGVNTAVISFSPYYRWNTIFVAILLVLVIIFNLIFIPLYGITGAAMAAAISILLYNVLMYFFLLGKYKFQPIGLKHLYILLITAGCFYIAYIIPVIQVSFLVDILVRSSCFTLLFGILILVTKVSPDINGTVNTVIKKFVKK